ncbi:MAG: hypothetical protein ACKOFH_04275, partial [Chthoniobacterales bacterium]
SRKKPGRKTAKQSPASEPCHEPGHCPPDDPPEKMVSVMPPRVKRRIPPEAERRAFEDAVNGWWWL